jgi:hypothetical protein
MELTTRELATVIVIVMVFSLVIAVSDDRRGLWRAIGGLGAILVHWKIWSILGAYAAWAWLVLLMTSMAGLWSSELLKEAILVLVVTGVPVLLSAPSLRHESGLVGPILKSSIGVSAFVTAYLGLVSLPLLAEVALQSIVLILVCLSVVAKCEERTMSLVRYIDGLVSIIVVGMFLWVGIHIGAYWSLIDWGREARAFVFLVWFPMLLIPFMYVVAMVSSLEVLFLRIRFHNGGIDPPVAVRIAVFVGTRARLKYASGVTGQWLLQLASCRSYEGAAATMRSYRSQLESG